MTEHSAHATDAAKTGVPNDPDKALAELQEREPLIHRGDLGTTRADFESLTTSDFWEVGASGRCYDRAFIWSALAQRSAEVADNPWDTSQTRCRQLSAETYLLTYLLRQGDRLTRRATIWQHGETGWQIIYHQGTVVSDPMTPLTASAMS